MEVPEIAYFALFTGFVVTAAWSDIRTRKIRNWLNGLFLVVGVAASLVVFGMDTTLWHLVHFLAAFALGIALNAFGVWGGGDAKFYAAMGAWFHIDQFFSLLLSFAVAGGFLAIGFFALRKLRGEKLFSGEQNSRELPYGVALAIGGLVVQAWLIYTGADPGGQLKAF